MIMVPYIDPNVRHCGVSELRKLNAAKLKDMQGAVVIQDNGEPVAVIVSYETFLAIQSGVKEVKAET